MAAISQKVSPDEVMPLLSRNVFLTGYTGAGRKGQPTEFLLLLRRYVQQARELAALAKPDGVIRVSSCDEAKTLLQVLGYKTRSDCGQSTTFLETADAQRAFLTTDSGFPLSELERTLSGGTAFAYAFPSSQVPILLTERDWIAVSDKPAMAQAAGTCLMRFCTIRCWLIFTTPGPMWTRKLKLPCSDRQV